jgi:hypothetical protein
MNNMTLVSDSIEMGEGEEVEWGDVGPEVDPQSSVFESARAALCCTYNMYKWALVVKMTAAVLDIHVEKPLGLWSTCGLGVTDN